MTASLVATEIALAELAYLVQDAGGDPKRLNKPVGLTTYFERDEVIALGHEIQAARLSSEHADDDVRRYFAAAGAIVAASPTVLAVRSGSEPATTSLYFIGSGPTVVVDITDGASSLTLHPEFPSEWLDPRRARCLQRGLPELATRAR